MCKCSVERSHPLPLRIAEHQQPVMEGIHMLWPLSVNPKQSNQQPTAVTAQNDVCFFPVWFYSFCSLQWELKQTAHLVCSQPQYLKGTCVSKTLSRSTLYWWKRQSEIQRQSCMTWSKKELSDKYVHNHNFSGEQDTYIYTTPTTLNVLTLPSPPLPSKCFYLLAQFVIHFWKLEVPEGKYQIEKYDFLLPSTTNRGAEMGEEPDLKVGESALLHTRQCHIQIYAKGSRLSFLNANLWENLFFRHAETQKLERTIQ